MTSINSIRRILTATLDQALDETYQAGMRQVEAERANLEVLEDLDRTHAVFATPSTPPVIVYAIPGAPPTDRTVRNADGDTWRRVKSGLWVQILSDDGWEWVDLLTAHGPLTLVDLTPEELEDAALYGPPGARWGDKDTPCAYVEAPQALVPTEGERCAYGTGHASCHRNVFGQALGLTVVTETDRTAGTITLEESAAHPCTCGHPEQHRAGCDRYNRSSGTPFDRSYIFGRGDS